MQTVRALSIICNKAVVVAYCPYNDTVIGPEHQVYLTLLFRSDDYIFCRPVVVAGGLKMPDTVGHGGLNLTEMSWGGKDSRQLARDGMERSVKDKIAAVVTAYRAVTFTREEDQR